MNLLRLAGALALLAAADRRFLQPGRGAVMVGVEAKAIAVTMDDAIARTGRPLAELLVATKQRDGVVWVWWCSNSAGTRGGDVTYWLDAETFEINKVEEGE